MCDTIAIVRDDGVWFAKNSDRDANEAQILEWHPRRTYPSGAEVKCTWIAIPQVEETCATLISRPFWMWGAEIGANEHGVTIGNEAVFTKQPYAKTGLTGMDLLRLALERAATAEEACAVIGELLVRHGQGGGCGLENPSFTYHNSFILADPERAFVLETAGRQWMVQEVRGVRSISNRLTISGFAENHSDRLYTWASGARTRQARTQALAESATGVGDVIALLRDHGDGRAEPRYSMLNGGLYAPCVHASGLAVATQTTASWVADLCLGQQRHWVTATAAPCTGLFKPVYVDKPLDLGTAATTDEPDDSLWWRHEQLHRAVLRNPKELMPLFVPERDDVESKWLANPPESGAAFGEGDRLLSTWSEAVQAHQTNDARPFWVRRYWSKRTACR